MANTINDLYTKYTNKVERTLENDRYFQYLFEIVQAGNNTIRQNNRVLHKVVDERWLTVVEEGLTSIFNIVDKPRRFIATTEEVVPVALARKITADSVRHLSQNTQFITTNAKGDIQPTKVLNVTTEESFDLYENRFVYHLIQRLFAFVDKRTDVIFWSTGDETCNTMCMESKIDDAYEEISYKVEMTVKNRQSFAENDNDNMDLFKRIDRVRRMSRTLRASSFCDIMNGCAKVRSPIQRTNLMMKDPDYRNCYKLWQFIESYDEVGYSIEEQDTALEFDEEYQTQMYINLITNYTIFKSLLESDPRKLTEIATKKRRPVKPKFIKKIQEEIVDNCDIPDVEVRKVFIEEVTQAQLDALQQQMDELEQKRAQIEEQKNALEAKLVEEKKAKEELQAAIEKADAEARAAIDNAQTEAKQAIEAAQKNIEQVREETQQNIEQIKAEAESEVQNAKSKVQSIQKQLEAIKSQSTEQIAVLQKNCDEQCALTQNKARESIDRTNQEANDLVERTKNEARTAIEELQAQLSQAKKQADKERIDKEHALEKAKANSLSHYIVNALRGRKAAADTSTDIVNADNDEHDKSDQKEDENK